MNKKKLKPSHILLTTFFALSISACSQPNTDLSVAIAKADFTKQKKAYTPQENPIFSISQDAETSIQNTASYATQLTQAIDKVKDGNYPYYGIISLLGIMTRNRSLLPTETTADQITNVMNQRLVTLGDTTKKAVSLEIENITFTVSQLKAMSPSAADKSNHEALIAFYETLKKVESAFLKKLEAKQLSIETAQDYFQTSSEEAFSEQNMTLESFGKKAEEIAPFIIKNSTTALREIMAKEPVSNNIIDHKYRDYYLDIRQELMRNYNAINRLGTNEDSEGKLLQQSLLLRGLAQEIGRTIPTDQNIESHRKLYDWAQAAAKMATNLYALKKTSAALDFDTLANNTTLMTDLGQWTIAVIQESIPNRTDQN